MPGASAAAASAIAPPWLFPLTIVTVSSTRGWDLAARTACTASVKMRR